MSKGLPDGAVTAHANTMWLCTHRCKEAADIYSYGVVLWEIITQETPQRGNLRDIEVSLECCACFACLAVLYRAAFETPGWHRA